MEKKELEELRIKDLFARLPYGVFVKHPSFEDEFVTFTTECHPKVQDAKAYLRPMSSMTEEEKNVLKDLCDITPYYDEEFGFVNIFGLGMFYRDSPSIDVSAIDWLNAHHFDYRGLIENGLALPAPEGMYK